MVVRTEGHRSACACRRSGAASASMQRLERRQVAGQDRVGNHREIALGQRLDAGIGTKLCVPIKGACSSSAASIALIPALARR